MIFFRGAQAAAAQKMMLMKKISLGSSREKAWKFAYGESSAEMQKKCSASREKYLKGVYGALDSWRERAWRVAYGKKYEEKQRTCLAARTKILKMDFRGPSISSIMIYAGFGDLLLKGATNLIWAGKKKFKEGAKELSRTLVGLDNKETMEAVRAMRIEMATMHSRVKAINRKVDLLLAGPTRPVRPTLPLVPPHPLSPKENGEAVGKVNGGNDSEVNGESDGEVNGGNNGSE